MQILYAAPFVLLSILTFAIFLAVPSLRRFALLALVVPVAFGTWSIAGWIAFVLISGFVLHIRLGPATGIHGIVEGLLFYLAPGVGGAWFAVRILNLVQRTVLRTAFAKSLVLAIAISCVAAFVAAFIGMAFTADVGLFPALVADLSIAAICASFAFLLSMRVQGQQLAQIFRKSSYLGDRM